MSYVYYEMKSFFLYASVFTLTQSVSS